MTVRFVAQAPDAGQVVEHAAVLYLDIDGPPPPVTGCSNGRSGAIVCTSVVYGEMAGECDASVSPAGSNCDKLTIDTCQCKNYTDNSGVKTCPCWKMNT